MENEPTLETSGYGSQHFIQQGLCDYQMMIGVKNYSHDNSYGFSRRGTGFIYKDVSHSRISMERIAR